MPGRRFNRSRATALGLVLALAAVTALALRAGRHAPVPTAAVLRHAPWPATEIDAAGATDAGHLAAIAHLLEVDDGVRRDLAFFYASAWLVRCDAPRGHDLVRLAARTGLPVMQAVSQALHRQPDLSRPLYDTIRQLAARTACDSAHPAQKVGPQHLHVDPADYANRFPDSYYQPDTDPDAPPAPLQDLHALANDPCVSVAYAILPLRADTPWQCAGARRDARRTVIRKLCKPEASAADNAATTAAPAAQRDMATAIHALLRGMPDLCQ